ncbi:MAG: hypothetical protein ACXWCG_00550 [Flavitalea sp.]
MKSTSPENFSAEESLQLIQSMIDKTRLDISSQSPYFLLWGWFTFAGCIGQVLLKVYFRYEHHYFIWLITIPCIIISLFLSSRNKHRVKAKTYVDASMAYLWTGIGISIFVLSLLFIVVGYQYCFPFFILFYGLGAFVSGRLLQFKPLVAGGIISWCLSAISIWLDFDHQALFAAASILFSYIIPGYLIARTHKTVT